MFLDVKLPYGKVIITFLDCVNKQGMNSVCIQRLKTSKLAVKNVNSDEKGKSKVRMMFFELKVQQDGFR